MDPVSSRHLKLGDELNGTVVKHAGGSRFVVTSQQVPRGWDVELHATDPEAIQLGSHTTFWVGRITPVKGQVLVYNGDFGRLPISAKMGARYLAAVQGLLGEAELTGETLGDARAMVARLGTQNQADWLTVWRLLSEPGPGDIKALLAAIDALRAARKEAPDTLPELLAEVQQAFGATLRNAAQRLLRILDRLRED